MQVRIAGRGRLTATATMRDGQLTIRIDDQRDPAFWAEIDITPKQLAALEASDDSNVADAVAADDESFPSAVLPTGPMVKIPGRKIPR